MKGQFYKNIFPTNWIDDWITCNGRYSMVNREIAMRWGENTFNRSHRFATSAELYNYLVVNTPDNVSLGPIHPDNKMWYTPRYCPLVFDMDMNEETKRMCPCAGTRNACDICWEQLMLPIMRNMQTFLVDLFKFESVLFVFSGKRGFHCFVLDSKVWEWTREQRMAFLHRIPTPIKFDENITIDLGHLVKMPLFPHQSTFKIACPIVDMEQFRPSHAVHINNITREQMEYWAEYIHGRQRGASTPSN